jgi:hypothetical protein
MTDDEDYDHCHLTREHPKHQFRFVLVRVTPIAFPSVTCIIDDGPTEKKGRRL